MKKKMNESNEASIETTPAAKVTTSKQVVRVRLNHAGNASAKAKGAPMLVLKPGEQDVDADLLSAYSNHPCMAMIEILKD